MLAAAAAESWPDEACGLLLGRREGDATIVEEVTPVENVEPIDRRRGFVIDPRAILKARERERAGGPCLVGFFHSHPGGGCRPSRRDEREAWLDLSYVIVASDGRLASWRREADGGFVEERVARPAANGGAQR